MHVGIAFDLRSDYLRQGYDEVATAEFESEDTIVGLERTLRQLGHRCERIGNAHDLMQAVSAGRRWDLVFNLCEGLLGFGREALVPALLDSCGIPYTFSDPLTMATALHKPTTKRLLRDLGLPTPEFAVVAEEADLADVALPFPLFAKPVAEGTSKGIDASCKVDSTDALRRVCMRLIRDFRQPVLVERFLPGREFTAGVIGGGRDARMVGLMEVILTSDAEPNAYSFRNKEHCEELVVYQPAEAAVGRKAESVVLATWRALGCRDAGRVDLKMDERGGLQILEVNPLPGLNETHSDLPILCRQNGIPFVELIGRIVESAAARVAAAVPVGATGSPRASRRA